MKKAILVLLTTALLILCYLASYSQTARYERLTNPIIAPGIKVTTSASIAANTSALFDVQSTTKGMKGPAMTAAQRIAISSPVSGLLVYDTDSGTYCVYSGSAWGCYDKGLLGTVGQQVLFNDKVTFADSLLLVNPPDRTSGGGRVLVIDTNGVVHEDSIFCSNIVPCDSGTVNIGSDTNHFNILYINSIVLQGNVPLTGAIPQVSKVTVPANRCDSLFTYPFELMAAPGSGKLTLVSNVFATLNFGTDSFDNNCFLNIYYNGVSDIPNQRIFSQGGVKSMLNSPISASYAFGPDGGSGGAGGISPNLITNAPIYINSSIDAYGTQGNSSLTLYITYTIVTP